MTSGDGVAGLLLGARGVLFDLDETLLVERRSAEAAVTACCAEARARYEDLDIGRMAADVFDVARELWQACPTIDYARAVGISSWEGLWASFAGPGDGLAALRSLSGGYRHGTWRGALARQGHRDEGLARDLAARFPDERRQHLTLFADAEPLLDVLAEARKPVSVVTNGAPDTQRAKLASTGLARYFGSVWVSGEVGSGKPGPCIWQLAAGGAGGPGPDVVAVGDSDENDIGPCLGLGLTAVRVDRSATGARRVADRSYVVGSLADLAPV